MPIDTIGKRLSVSEKFRAKGIAMKVRQPVYVGELRTGENDLNLFGLVVGESTLKNYEGDRIQGVEISVMLGALTTDDAGVYDGGVLALKKGDYIFYKDAWIEVVDPNPVAPNIDPIFFEPVAQTQPQRREGYKGGRG